MKTLLFIIFLLISRFAVAINGVYDPYLDDIYNYEFDEFSNGSDSIGNDCSDQGNLSPIEDLLGKDIPGICSSLHPSSSNSSVEYCNCLEEKKNQNVLLLDLVQSEGKDQSQKRLEMEMKFRDSYTQMVIEDNLQRFILGEEIPTQNVECTAKTMGEFVEKAANAHLSAQKDFLLKKQSELDAKAKECNSPKIFYKLWNTFSCNAVNSQLPYIKKRIEEWDKRQIETFSLLSKPISCDEDIKDELIEYFTQVDIGVEGLKEKLIGLKGKDSCTKDDSEIIRQVSEIREKILSVSASPCEGIAGAVGCNFDQLNKSSAKKLAKAYEFDESTQCVSFAEYKTFKSIPPDDNFLNGLEKDPLNFLSPVPVKENDQDYQNKMNFLRSNPMLAKIIQHPAQNTEELQRILKKLAKDLKNKTAPQKLKIYLDFLKDKEGLQSLAHNKDGKTNELKVCSDLARNYTALRVADYFPTESNPNPNLDKGLKKELKKCKKINDKTKEENNSLETLKVDPVFNLGNKHREISDEQQRDDYRKFLAENCHTLPEKQSYKDYMEKCLKDGVGMTTKTCRQKFLSVSPFHSINDVMSTYPINTNPGANPGDLLDHLKDENQDQEFINWFKESVAPKYFEDPIGVFGMKSYMNNRSFGHSYKGATRPPQTNSASSSRSVPSASASASASADPSPIRHNQGKQTVNPGQVMPRFNSPAKTQSAAGRQVEPNRAPASASHFPSRDIQGSSSSGKSSSFDESVSSEKDLSQDLAENEERSKKLGNMNTTNEKSKASPSRGVSMNSSFSPSPSSMVAPGARNLLGPNRGPTALGPSPYKKGTFNDALNSIHEKSAMQILGGAVDPKEFKGPQQSAKDLIVDDPIKFEKLGEDPVLLEAFIKEKMKGMVVGESKIITIINASPNRPVPHMIFRIKAKEDGSFDIQSVPSEVPVRVATLKSLLDQLPKQ